MPNTVSNLAYATKVCNPKNGYENNYNFIHHDKMNRFEAFQNKTTKKLVYKIMDWCEQPH